MTPTFYTKKITPALARAWLEHNHDNRNIREAVVARFARDMKAGRWLLSGAPIVRNGNGSLIDGQHRLLACIRANVSFTTLVFDGADETVKAVLDTGSVLMVPDPLQWKGETCTHQLAALITLGWRYDTGVMKSTLQPTRAEAFAWLEANPAIREEARRTTTYRRHIPVTGTALGIVRFLTARVDEGDADTFATRLIEGANLDEASPILATRRWIDGFGAKRDRPSTLVYTGTILKGCNYWREGRVVKFLRWTPDEPFPHVWGEE